MTADCKFCQVAAGSLASDIVFEDEASITFLDHRPLMLGHCLVIPREHYETLPDLPPDLLAPLFETVRLVARAVEAGLGAEGSFIAINNRVSQSVPHVHIHVVPRRRKDGLKGFFWPRQSYKDPAEVLAVLRSLQEAIERIRASAP